MVEIDSGLRGKSGIYKITCTKNGMSYIGQSTNLSERLHEHFAKMRRGNGRNKRMLSDFAEFGEDSFEVEVFLFKKEMLDEMEREYIKRERDNGRCYNVFSGGRTGYKADDEFREKASKIHSGRFVSDHEKMLHASCTKKQWNNEEYRRTMVNSAKRQWQDEGYRKIMRDAHLKISDDIAELAYVLHNSGATKKSIAQLFSVSDSTIARAIDRYKENN